MGAWKLWTQDAALGRMTGVSATSGSASAPNVVDGDPSNRWVTTSTGAVLTIALGGAWNIYGLGLANCSGLGGGSLTVTGVSGLSVATLPGSKDLLISDLTAHTLSSMVLTFAGCTSGFSIGEVCLLSDYFPKADGTATDGSGYAVIDIGSTATPGGVAYPIGRAASTGVATVGSSGGFLQSQVVGGVSQEIRLTIQALCSGQDEAFDKIWRSFIGDAQANLVNVGWAKPCWLQTDEWSDTARHRCYYVVGTPGQELTNSIANPSGNTECILSFRTLSRG